MLDEGCELCDALFKFEVREGEAEIHCGAVTSNEGEGARQAEFWKEEGAEFGL